LAALPMTPFLQCLHCCRSGTSSRGRPLVKVSWCFSSRLLMTGLGEDAAMIEPSLSLLVFFFSSAAVCVSIDRVAIGAACDAQGCAEESRYDEPSSAAASFHAPGLLSFGAPFFNLRMPLIGTFAEFLAEATFMVVASSSVSASELVGCGRRALPNYVCSGAARVSAIDVPLRDSIVAIAEMVSFYQIN
jgi:hypothetical protein